MVNKNVGSSVLAKYLGAEVKRPNASILSILFYFLFIDDIYHQESETELGHY